MHVPICVPSAEQTLSPGVVHEVEEPAGAEGAADGIAGATEGAAGGVGFSEGAAAAGATTAAFSWTPTLCTASAAFSAVVDGEDCTAGDGLGCVVELPSEAPGTVQPMGDHSIPGTLPSPFGAIFLNKSGMASISPNLHPWHVSTTVAMVSVPAVGLWMEICLLQMGLLFGFPGLFITGIERATTASLLWIIPPQDANTESVCVEKKRNWESDTIEEKE